MPYYSNAHYYTSDHEILDLDNNNNNNNNDIVEDTCTCINMIGLPSPRHIATAGKGFRNNNIIR